MPSPSQASKQPNETNELSREEMLLQQPVSEEQAFDAAHDGLSSEGALWALFFAQQPNQEDAGNSNTSNTRPLAGG